MKVMKAKVNLGKLHRAAASQKGITLIELMFTLLVISILVTAATPVMITYARNADDRVAALNYRMGEKFINFVWYDLEEEETQIPPGQQGRYRDWFPPEQVLASEEYRRNSFSRINALYMSCIEYRTSFVDMRVLGNGKYRIYGVYKNGVCIADGPGIYEDWSLLTGRIIILEHDYWYGGRWNHNQDDYYHMFMTVAKNGLARYSTFYRGQLIDYGFFEWLNGEGHP